MSPYGPVRKFFEIYALEQNCGVKKSVYIINETKWGQSLQYHFTACAPTSRAEGSPLSPQPYLHLALSSFLIFASLTDTLYLFVVFTVIYLTP